MRSFYGTIHRLGENPGFPPIAEGRVDLNLACPGVISVELEGRVLIHVSAELVDRFYPGMSLMIPGGMMLCLYNSADEAISPSEVWQQSLRRMNRDLEKILAGEDLGDGRPDRS